MKNRRKSSIKVVTTVALFIVTVLAVTVGIVTVFALTQHSVDSNIFIRYTATDIDGSVKATYQLIGKESKDNGEIVDMGTVYFSATDGTSDQEISPKEDLKLTNVTPYIEFTYIFTNNGSRDFTATVSLKDVVENNNISFNYAYQNYEYLDDNFSILVQGVETGKNVVTYKIKMGVESFAKNAGFKGSLFWDLKRFKSDDATEQQMIDQMVFTESEKGYSVSYDGGALENNTLIITSQVGPVKVTSVGKIKNLPFKAKVIIGEGITSIETGAFSGSLVSEVELPDGLENVGDDSFLNTLISNLTIPASVTSIGAGAFAQTGLTSITVDQNNKHYKIDGNCLIEIATNRLIQGFNDSVIPSYVEIIEDKSFAFQKKLTSITLPNGLKRIGELAFNNCKSLTAVEFPQSLEILGYASFHNCGLTEVIITENIKEIGEGTFGGNPLISITVDENNSNFRMIDNCLVDVSNRMLLQGFNDSIIPTDGSVISIGQYAFADLTELTSIIIPSIVTSIGFRAFTGCTNLTDMEFEITTGWVYRSSSSYSGKEIAIDPQELTNLLTEDWWWVLKRY